MDSAGASGTWASAARRQREPPARVMMASGRPSGSAGALGGWLRRSSGRAPRPAARDWHRGTGPAPGWSPRAYSDPRSAAFGHVRARVTRGRPRQESLLWTRRPRCPQTGSGHGFWLLRRAAGDRGRGAARGGEPAAWLCRKVGVDPGRDANLWSVSRARDGQAGVPSDCCRGGGGPGATPRSAGNTCVGTAGRGPAAAAGGLELDRTFVVSCGFAMLSKSLVSELP